MKRKFVYDYLNKKQKALGGQDPEVLRERLYQIKKTSINNLIKLKKQAVKNFIENGISVYQAKTNKQTREIIKKIVGKEKYLVKAKSNTLNEIEIKELANQNDWDLTETDIGDFLAEFLGKGVDHPVLPALTIKIEEIIKKINKLDNKVNLKTPKQIVDFLSKLIRKKILKAKIGLTGANALTANGEILILENEGNISLVSRLPKTHIVVAGIEKIVPTLEDALHITRCASIWATGQRLTSYINIISGPSKTADIQNKLVIGAQGAGEVHLILVDDWRSDFIKSPFRQMLYCINCGACFDTCPVFISQDLIIKIFDPKKNFKCSLCGTCTLVCPARINWQKLTLEARKLHLKNKKAPKQVYKMIENIRKFGNPFGKIKKGKIKNLYCC